MDKNNNNMDLLSYNSFLLFESNEDDVEKEEQRSHFKKHKGKYIAATTSLGISVAAIVTYIKLKAKKAKKVLDKIENTIVTNIESTFDKKDRDAIDFSTRKNIPIGKLSDEVLDVSLKTKPIEKNKVKEIEKDVQQVIKNTETLITKTDFIINNNTNADLISNLDNMNIKKLSIDGNNIFDENVISYIINNKKDLDVSIKLPEILLSDDIEKYNKLLYQFYTNDDEIQNLKNNKIKILKNNKIVLNLGNNIKIPKFPHNTFNDIILNYDSSMYIPDNAKYKNASLSLTINFKKNDNVLTNIFNIIEDGSQFKKITIKNADLDLHDLLGLTNKVENLKTIELIKCNNYKKINDLDTKVLEEFEKKKIKIDIKIK